MFKSRNIKEILDWVIRLQGAYAILATLLAGGMGTALRAVLRSYTSLEPIWITPIWVAFTTAILALMLFAGSKLGNFIHFPEFELGISGIVWTYEEVPDRTLVFFGTRLLNRGAPSISQNWSAKYVAGASEEMMTGFYLVDPYILTLGKERLTVENSDLLNVKTAEKALERGCAGYGRLLFVLPGDRRTQLKSIQFRIEVKTQDYTGREYVSEYLPSSTHLTSLMRHPFEKGEFIKAPEGEASGQTQAPTK